MKSPVKLVFPLLLLLMLYFTPVSHALHLRDLWSRPDQQGSLALKNHNPEKAAALFKNRAWKGVAYYRAGQYQNALRQFTGIDTPMGHYNRGNAFARLGQYKDAISAYEISLKQQPNFPDAQYNLALVKTLLQQQQSQDQQSQGQQSQNQQSQNQQSQNQQSQNQQSQNQQSQNQQSQDQQSQNQQSQNQQSPGQQSQNQQSQDQQQDSPSQPQPQETQAQQETTSVDSPQTTEQNQALQQWLQQIPDNPSGLLREKFLRDHNRQQANNREE